MLFPAPTIGAQDLSLEAEAANAREVRYAASDGVQVYGWHYPAQGRRAVLYFHGNASYAGSNPRWKQTLVAAGWDVIAASYRGYPGAQGKPSEVGLKRDAMAAWNFVTQELAIPPHGVVLHGRSLGGGVAGTIMTEVEPAGIVLESTFLSARARATSLYPWLPVRWLMTSPFLTADRAPGVQVPVLVLHSDGDDVIPVDHGRALSRLFSNGRYVEEVGLAHNDDMLMEGARAPGAYQAFLKQVMVGELENP